MVKLVQLYPHKFSLVGFLESCLSVGNINQQVKEVIDEMKKNEKVPVLSKDDENIRARIF
jgi:hypothetical protein